MQALGSSAWRRYLCLPLLLGGCAPLPHPVSAFPPGTSAFVGCWRIEQPDSLLRSFVGPVILVELDTIRIEGWPTGAVAKRAGFRYLYRPGLWSAQAAGDSVTLALGEAALEDVQWHLRRFGDSLAGIVRAARWREYRTYIGQALGRRVECPAVKPPYDSPLARPI